MCANTVKCSLIAIYNVHGIILMFSAAFCLWSELILELIFPFKSKLPQDLMTRKERRVIKEASQKHCKFNKNTNFFPVRDAYLLLEFTTSASFSYTLEISCHFQG
jgi:hypothetical protein